LEVAPLARKGDFNYCDWWAWRCMESRKLYWDDLGCNLSENLSRFNQFLNGIGLSTLTVQFLSRGLGENLQEAPGKKELKAWFPVEFP
jgi:hypothetical protein